MYFLSCFNFAVKSEKRTGFLPIFESLGLGESRGFRGRSHQGSVPWAFKCILPGKNKKTQPQLRTDVFYLTLQNTRKLSKIDRTLQNLRIWGFRFPVSFVNCHGQFGAFFSPKILSSERKFCRISPRLPKREKLKTRDTFFKAFDTDALVFV